MRTTAYLPTHCLMPLTEVCGSCLILTRHSAAANAKLLYTNAPWQEQIRAVGVRQLPASFALVQTSLRRGRTRMRACPLPTYAGRESPCKEGIARPRMEKAMSMRRGRLFLLACCAALLIALLSVPGAERLGLIGTVAAQELSTSTTFMIN